MCKTKSLLREKVWFPEMNKEVEKQLGQCVPCPAATAKNS